MRGRQTNGCRPSRYERFGTGSTLVLQLQVRDSMPLLSGEIGGEREYRHVSHKRTASCRVTQLQITVWAKLSPHGVRHARVRQTTGAPCQPVEEYCVVHSAPIHTARRARIISRAGQYVPW